MSNFEKWKHRKLEMCPSEPEWPASQHSVKWGRHQLIKEAMTCYWGSNNTLPKKHELGVRWVNWVNWVTPNLETLKKSLQKTAYCRKTCKFRPPSDRPTVGTDVQNWKCITSIYIHSFQIDFRFQISQT